MAGTLQTPTVGSPNSSEEPKIPTAISTLNGLLTSSNLLDGAQLGAGTVPNAAPAGSISGANLASGAALTNLASGSVTDAKLASPNNSAYRTISTAKGLLVNDATAGTYALGTQAYSVGGGGGVGITASGGSWGHSTAGFAIAPDLFYFDDADYTVAGLTQKLRLRAQVAANATQPTITFTFGLHPVTVAGGADLVVYTLGAAVASSTVAIASPPASTVTSSVNSDFTIPSDGAFALGVVTSGTLTNNAAVGLHAQLQTRNV